MSEGHPHRPGTSRSGASGKIPRGHASPSRPIQAKAASSTHIQRPGTTRRGPTATKRTEIISSGEDAEVSQVRRRVAAPKFRTSGMSLRWKVVFAMIGITVATAIGIFFVIYNKALEKLEAEIDTKGERMVSLLSSIDEKYWLTAIHALPNARETELVTLIRELGGRQDWERQLRNSAEFKRIFAPLGATRELEVDAVITDATGRPVSEWKADLTGLKKTYYERLARPLPSLESLQPLRSLQREGDRDILEAGVVDVSQGKGNAPCILIQGPSNMSNLPERAGQAPLTKVNRIVQTGTVRIPARMFIREPRPNSPNQLRYFVSLSLAGIDKAKAELRTAILLPMIVALILGTGIAIWISTLITEPIKVLMHDMNQVSSGKLDHQTIPVSKDEVGQLAMTFNRMTSALRAAQDTEAEARAMEHDLNIASEIQSNLVPKRMLKIPGYDIGAYYRPSKEVGGDYYDFMEINEDLEGIIVADVSGKGVPGSLVMSMARAFIRMEAERNHNVSAADTLSKVNRMLANDIKKGMFVTALYCILNKRSNELLVASAGHNPMVVWRAAQNQVTLVNPNGIALGFDKGPVFERTAKEERLVLNRGDRVVLFTDGAVEAMDAQNREFGDKPFYGLVKELATRDSNQMLNLVMKTLDEHKGNAPQTDDITIVTLRYL